MVLLVIMASAAIGWLLTFDQMPQGIAQWVQQNVHAKWLVILLMNLMMLFIGMFIDLPAAVLLLTPVFVPLAHAIGMDPVQLGLMMVVNLAIGLYTPPGGHHAVHHQRDGQGQGRPDGARNGALLPGGFRRAGARVLRAGLHPEMTATNCSRRSRCIRTRRPAGASAYRIRRYALRMGEVQGQGYIGQALGWADVLAVAYCHAMNLRADEPEWEGRDRFLLSHGHYAIAHYAALIEAGIIPESELETYGSDDSRLPMSGMATYTPGMEISGGSLGQGLVIGVGMALGLKQKKNPAFVYNSMSDGELDEGSTWEAAMGAAPPPARQPDLPGRHQQPAGRWPVGQGARLRAAGRQVGRLRLACAARQRQRPVRGARRLRPGARAQGRPSRASSSSTR